MAKREFYVVIVKDEDGVLIGRVPQLRGCHSNGRTMDELMANMREVILLCMDERLDVDDIEEPMKFVGIQRVEV